MCINVRSGISEVVEVCICYGQIIILLCSFSTALVEVNKILSAFQKYLKLFMLQSPQQNCTRVKF